MTPDIKTCFTRARSLQASSFVWQHNATQLHPQQSGLITDFDGVFSSMRAALIAVPMQDMIPLNDTCLSWIR